MIQDFLEYINHKEIVIVAIVAFGIIPLGILIYIFDSFLKAIGLRTFAEFIGALFAIPIGFTWIGGFVLSILLFSSNVSGLKILLILIGLFLISLLYSALNFVEIKSVLADKNSSIKDKLTKTKKRVK